MFKMVQKKSFFIY